MNLLVNLRNSRWAKSWLCFCLTLSYFHLDYSPKNINLCLLYEELIFLIFPLGTEYVKKKTERPHPNVWSLLCDQKKQWTFQIGISTNFLNLFSKFFLPNWLSSGALVSSLPIQQIHILLTWCKCSKGPNTFVLFCFLFRGLCKLWWLMLQLHWLLWFAALWRRVLWYVIWDWPKKIGLQVKH